MKELKVVLLHDKAVPPKRAYNSNGFDLHAYGNHIISVNETKIISTGFAAELDPGYVALVWDRGSLGSQGITTLAGVIDSDYRGIWSVVLHNLSDQQFLINHGDKIAQFLIHRVEHPEVIIVKELSTTERGAKALGSTDKGTTAEEAQNTLAAGHKSDKLTDIIKKHQ
jgi:dUTP pyrophosphatase